MEVVAIPLSAYMSNCYVAYENSKALVIDIGGNPKDVITFLKNNKLTPECVLLTHGHTDHIDGVDAFLEEYNVPVYLNNNDKIHVENKEHIYGTMNSKSIDANENTKIMFNDKVIKVIETPGHTPGGVCFLIDNMLFSGDTLFRLSIGRTDLLGGDFDSLINAIKTKLLILDEETIVYPGHMSPSNIGTEKKYNSFLK